MGRPHIVVPVSPIPITTIFLVYIGLLRHSDHMLHAAVAADHHYPYIDIDTMRKFGEIHIELR